MTLAYLGDSGIVLLGGDERPQSDAYDVRWQWNGTTPWAAGPSPRAVTGDRGTDDGSWDATRYYAARTYTLEGYAHAQDHDALHAAEQRLRTACGIQPFALRVVEPGFDRQGVFRKDGQFLWTETTPGLARFSVPLWAGDPRAYGSTSKTAQTGFPSSSGGLEWPATWPATWDAVVVAGVLRATNLGDATARPTFRIDGPVVDPVIVNADTGQAMHLDLELLAGEWVTIDVASHQVLANGDPGASRRDKWWGDWFGFEPGDTTVSLQSASSGIGAQLTATYRDTWI